MFIRKIVVILIILIVAAVAFQVVRSYFMTRLIKNTNQYESLLEPVSAEIPKGIRFEKYLIISDSQEENSIKTTEQLEKVLDYMKKEYKTIDVSDGINEKLDFDCIFFVFERLDKLANLDYFLNYVKEGKSLVFLIRPVLDKSFESISSLLGITEFNGIKNDNRGIRMLTDIVIGAEGFVSDTGIINNSSINLKLDRSAEIYISSYENIPLLWKTAYGRGSFVVFNGTMLNGKSNRGLTAAVISLGKENFIYPIANIKMLHIDDFPALIPQGTDEKIYEEFSRDIPQFYREVWWSDMVMISKKYDLKYSSFVIEAYNNNTTPPFTKASSTVIQNLLIYGKELLNIGGEIGLHGYNHQSLVPEGYIKQDLGYVPWDNEENMSESIKTLIGFIKDAFPYYELRAYVPPSNILSKEGRNAVIEANPELKIIASVYLPNIEGDAYDQEFELTSDGILEFPRFSYGYIITDGIMWKVYNGINMHGIFSHFVHPDDILDPERSEGKSWSELTKEFESILGEVNDKYGWLRSYTISSGGQELIKYLQVTPYISYSDNRINIYCENFRADAYFIMRTDNEIIDAQNCEFSRIGKNTYLLALRDSQCSISLKEK